MNNQMETRYEKWCQASHGLAHVEAFMVPILQGLGHFDCILITEDERIRKLTEQDRSTIEEGSSLTNQYTLSCLWVFGAYELVRSLKERCSTNESLLNRSLNNSLNNLKLQIERVRIPLAKMKPAKKHPSDSPIAFPALNRESGVAWQLDTSVFVTRRDLSDALLQLITDIEEYVSTPK